MKIIDFLSKMSALLKKAIRMSPENARVVVIHQLIETLNATITWILPGLLIRLVMSDTDFSIIILSVICYAAILLAAKGGSLGFGLLETALGYAANNYAALEVSQKGMRMSFQSFEDSDNLVKRQRAMESTYIFSNVVDCVFGHGIHSIVALISGICILSQGKTWILCLLLLLSIAKVTLKRQFRKNAYLVKKNYARSSLKRDYYYGLLTDYACAKELRLYDAEPLFLQKYSDAEKEVLVGLQKSKLLEKRGDVFGLVLTMISAIVVYVTAIEQSFAGILAPAFFVIFISALHLLEDGITEFFLLFSETGELLDRYHDFCAFTSLREPSAQEGSNTPAEPWTLSFENVTFRYPNAETDALQNITFQLKPGEMTAIVGDNGSGKTTLVLLICRLLEPTKGRIVLDGKDLREYRLEEYLRHIAPVFQDYQLHAYSLRENIAFLDEEENGVWDAIKQAGVYGLVDHLPNKLETYVSRLLSDDGCEFSGGERQQLSLARALYKIRTVDDPVFLLDEPTSALDPLREKAYIQRIHDITNGKTTVYITQQMASTQLADQILVLKKGRLLECGPFDELMAQNGLFATMFNEQKNRYVDAGVE